MLVLIADSHVAPGGATEAEFFQMLSAISQTTHDVMFLGDNLDIWIASAPKYENDTHRRFLAWCSAEKARRRIVMVEGNHEFYVTRRHVDAFTSSTETLWRERGITFVHGDMAHSPWGFHRLFRGFAKNRFGDFIMSWLPGGVSFSLWMKRILAHDARRKPSRPTAADFIPVDRVDAWVGAECRASGSRLVLMGHFHQGLDRTLPSGVHYRILPAWKNDQFIGLLDEATRELAVGNWRELLTPPRHAGAPSKQE